MARARDPARDKAKEMYLNSSGEMLLKDIASELGKSDSLIRKWKNQDKWDDEMNGNVTNETNSNVTNKKQSNIPIKKAAVEEEVIYFENDETTDKQRLFIAYYVKYWNATKAYQKAYGCAYSTARTEGSRLLANPNIREEIIKVRDELTQDALLDKRSLLQKWIDVAFADITDYVKFGRQEEIEYNDDGQPALDMNGNIKTYSFNYVHLNESTDVDGTLITEVKQGKDGITIKLADKMKALEFLSKHMDLLNDNERKQLQLEQIRANTAKTKAETTNIEGDKNNNGSEDWTQALLKVADRRRVKDEKG